MSTICQRLWICMLAVGFGSCSHENEDTVGRNEAGEEGDAERRFSSDLERNNGAIPDGFRLDTGLARRVTSYLAGHQLYFVVPVPKFDTDRPETGVSLSLCTDGRFKMWEEITSISGSITNVQSLKILNSGTWLIATSGPKIRLVLTPQKGDYFDYELTENDGHIYLDNQPVKIDSSLHCD